MNKWYEDYMRSHSHGPGLNKNMDLARRCSAKHSLRRQSMIRKMKISRLLIVNLFNTQRSIS